MLKTFLINLDRRPDRLDFIKKQLDDLGIIFERISAIDGNNCSDEQLQFFNRTKFSLECKRQLVPGEIGCALSHRLVWQQMVDNQIPYALILEDDIEIDSRLTAILSNPQNYQHLDFLNLAIKEPYEINVEAVQACTDNQQWIRPHFWQSRRLWQQMENKGKVRWKIFKIHSCGNGIYTCECNPAPALACCYIISLQAAREFLSTSENIFYPIDKVWHHSRGLLRQAVLTHRLAVQILDSDIQNRLRFKLTFWQKIKRFFIKSRHWYRRLAIIRLYGWSRL